MARFLVTLDRSTGGWLATAFIPIHNHNIASPSELQFLRSHRVIPPQVVCQAKSMRAARIRTISILDFIAHQYGGREKLPFQKKDLYNILTIDRRTINTETDCEGALGYLTCLASRLHTIFWADGKCRRDYALFGEVVAFDTTYRTNAYKKPLLFFVGVNNHYRTTVFGIALLPDETIPTFTWVLQQFRQCMNNNDPKVVLTDGDHVMKAAIVDQLPQTKHRLCAWHLETNAGSNVPNTDFKSRFSQLLYRYYSTTEFEDKWKELITAHNLVGDEWANSLYDKRTSWAETFLRGNFFAGMRTTQRCESINSYMQRFINAKMLLRDFFSQIDQAQQALRHSEMQDDFLTLHSEPVFPINDPLYSYYVQVATTCTRNIYNIIAKQIEAHTAYSVQGCNYAPDVREYRLSKFRVGEIPHTLKYTPSTHFFNCKCLLFETDGIPCRHIFVVMKHLSVEHVPPYLLRPCWHKDIKHSTQFNTTATTLIPTEILHTTRMGTLASHAHTLAFYASKYPDRYDDTLRQLQSWTDRLKSTVTLREPIVHQCPQHFDEDLGSTRNVLRDPIVAKTK